jgi:4a-hydroxytetrahydrobiopterin dehydratase
MLLLAVPAAAVKFFNEVMEVAEAEGHHPDLHLTGYRNVEVSLGPRW